MKTKKMTTAGAIVEFLKNQYISIDGVENRFIEHFAGIFGHGNVAGLGQAIEEIGKRDFQFIQPKNEQAMIHTAVAFSKANRRRKAFACTTSIGPGATNMVTGAATATINRLPVLLFPGDIFANRRPDPVLQQLENAHSMDMSVNDCFKPISKYWDRINRPEQILTALPEALRILTDPAETGAVCICLPQDVQAESMDFPLSFFEKKVYYFDRDRPSDERINQAVESIKKSESPMLLVGGGAFYSEADSSIENFISKTGIAAAVTQTGKSCIDENQDRVLGAVGVTGNLAANALARKTDLVLSLGVRYSDFTTSSRTQFENPNVRFINININSKDAFKMGGLPLIGDVQFTLDKISERLNGYKVSSNYSNFIEKIGSEWDADYKEMTDSKENLSQGEVLRVLNESIGPDSVIVHAAGGIPGDVHKLWKSLSVGQYHSEYGYSCMGYEIAGAFGVKLANQKKEVYALVGDGSYLMLNQELATIQQEGLKINIVLIDNGGYQCIHNLQRGCGGESFGNEFRTRSNETKQLSESFIEIDYVKNAESFGIKVFTCDSEVDLKSAIEKVKKSETSTMIYIKLKEPSNLKGYSWWDVPMSSVSENPKTQKIRREYEEKIKNWKFYY